MHRFGRFFGSLRDRPLLSLAIACGATLAYLVVLFLQGYLSGTVAEFTGLWKKKEYFEYLLPLAVFVAVIFARQAFFEPGNRDGLFSAAFFAAFLVAVVPLSYYFILFLFLLVCGIHVSIAVIFFQKKSGRGYAAALLLSAGLITTVDAGCSSRSHGAKLERQARDVAAGRYQLSARLGEGPEITNARYLRLSGAEFVCKTIADDSPYCRIIPANPGQPSPEDIVYIPVKRNIYDFDEPVELLLRCKIKDCDGLMAKPKPEGFVTALRLDFNAHDDEADDAEAVRLRVGFTAVRQRHLDRVVVIDGAPPGNISSGYIWRALFWDLRFVAFCFAVLAVFLMIVPGQRGGDLTKVG